ncbi:MAG: YhcH/YjgK/YiaL family protein [Atopobiaceae bacterium]|nr:YhcH/YjgK/YiaL family protein [Atopobiaceae bacterium]
MIVDSMRHIRDYEAILPGICAGMDFIESAGQLELGRHDFEGGYVVVAEGSTTPVDEGLFEAHNVYADVQIILDGSEEVAWAEREALDVVNAYDPDGEAEMLEGPRTHTMLIEKGMFWIAFPHDAHRPAAHTTRGHSYRKIIMKLPVR